MHIGIVGGIERGWGHYERLASRAGHDVELHYGHMHGRGQDTLETLVQRSELVVIVTDINSHLAVQQARKLVTKYGRRLLISRNFGVAKFSALLEALAGENARTAAVTG